MLLEVVLAASAIFFSVVWLTHYRRRRRRISPGGKAVFLTGCDSGIGFQSALLLDNIGFHVFAGCLFPHDKGSNQLKEKASHRMTIVALDVTDRDSINKAQERVAEECKNKNVSLWCVVNNAGVCVGGELEWLTVEQCQKQVNVNLMGTINITKAFLPLLRESKGRIINITSINGSWAYPGISVYCATKYALEGLSASLRMELRRVGVSVVVIAPGDYARLTNIMDAQIACAKEQWDALRPELRSTDGEYFWSVQESTCQLAGLLSPPTFQESPLMKDMEEAVMCVQPKARYVSATRNYRFFIAFLRSLRTEWSDAIMLWTANKLLKAPKTSFAKECITRETK